MLVKKLSLYLALAALSQVAISRAAFAETTVINTGEITRSGYRAYGVPFIGSSNIITNSGSITTSGQESFGVLGYGNSNIITNSGSIITSGVDSYGVYGYGNSNIITNSGSITTSGYRAYGVNVSFDSNIITNSGSIITSGYGGAGVIALGNSNTITNSGSITTSGDYALGVYAFGKSNTITNTGSITTSGVGAYGVYVNGNSNTITNSGSIISKYGYAIYFSGIGNTLNILNNFMGGGINLGTSGVARVTTGPNYSKLYSFEGTNLTISGSGPVPLFINAITNKVATFDPTIFAGSTDALADMAYTVSSLADGRLGGFKNDHPLWFRGFGIASGYKGSNTTLQRNYNFYGGAMGYDFKRTSDLTLGVLAGYGTTKLYADAESVQSFQTTSDNGFLGFYGQKRWSNVAVDFALYGGMQDFDQHRYVNDNLAYLGNSRANASYKGWWIAPEAGLTYRAGEVNGWSILPTAKLRYAHQWLEGYTETGGGDANANIASRNFGIGQAFVGIGTRKIINTTMGKDTKMVLDGQVGYMYRGVTGSKSVDVTMIGQSLSLPTETSDRSAVVASAAVMIDLSSAVAFKLRGDVAGGGDMKLAVGGWAGLSFKF